MAVCSRTACWRRSISTGRNREIGTVDLQNAQVEGFVSVNGVRLKDPSVRQGHLHPHRLILPEYMAVGQHGARGVDEKSRATGDAITQFGPVIPASKAEEFEQRVLVQDSFSMHDVDTDNGRLYPFHGAYERIAPSPVDVQIAGGRFA